MVGVADGMKVAVGVAVTDGDGVGVIVCVAVGCGVAFADGAMNASISTKLSVAGPLRVPVTSMRI